MRKILFILAVVLIGAISGFSQASGTISGRISYGKNVALHNVTVQLVQTKQTTETNEEGAYELTGISPGRYTVLVHLEGFADEARSVDIAANEKITLDFALKIASLKEQVTVTASGTEQSVFDSFQTVNSVGSTRITEKAATSLGDVLDGETGVAKRSFGPGSSRPVIRGFDGDRVLVLEGGVRTGSVGSQSGDHGETIDPLGAERIEVVKGPGTLLYGSNAIGGVVNVISHDDDEASDGFRGFVTGVGGTADKQGGIAGGLEYGIRKFLVRGNLSAQRSGDFRSPIGDIPNSATRSNSGSVTAGYFGAKAYFRGTYGFDVRRYGIPFAALFEGGASGGEGSLGELPVVDEDIDLRARKHNVRFGGGFRNLTNPYISGVQYSVDLTNYRHKEIERSDSVDTVGTIFDNRTFSYRSLFEQAKRGKLSGRFGFEGLDREYEVNGAEQLIQGKVKHKSFSAFGLEELNFDRVKIQFGARIENNGYRPENADLTERSFTGLSGGVGVNVALWSGGSFVANYTHSFRAPALEELYNNGPHIGTITFEVGNQSLRSETADGLDLSLRHQSRRFRFSGDVYYYSIDNFVYLARQDLDGDGQADIEDGLPLGRYEQNKAAYLGAEFNADITINDYIGAFASFDAVRARLTDLDLDLPRIPPARGRIGLELRYKDLSVRPEAVFASAQKHVYSLETPTAGYGIVNVAGSYTVGRQHFAHIFSFNAYNLTDKLYRNHVSFIKDLVPEIGRGIRFGYTLRFF
ncbi:MAG: TonB-dependent receptor [Pyrinomonadaceae bacterium]